MLWVELSQPRKAGQRLGAELNVSLPHASSVLGLLQWEMREPDRGGMGDSGQFILKSTEPQDPPPSKGSGWLPQKVEGVCRDDIGVR